MFTSIRRYFIILQHRNLALQVHGVLRSYEMLNRLSTPYLLRCNASLMKKIVVAS